jgi:carboxyl-terminal processing protease
MNHEKLSIIEIALLTKFHIFNFATKYRSTHKEIGAAKDFRLKEEEYQDFLASLKDKDYSYKAKSEIELEEAKKQAIAEKSFDPAQGARFVRKNLQDMLEDKVAEKIIENKKTGTLEILAEVKKGQIEITAKKNAKLPQPVTA